MTTGSGLYINPTEKDPIKQNTIMRQLIEGRSNAVGIITLVGNGSTTSVTVKAINCSPSSAVFLFPATADAATEMTSLNVSSVAKGSFTVVYQASPKADLTYFWLCLG